MLVARRYVVRGRVQGVGFRFFAQRAADWEGLHGWVRNADDGSVEIEAEGDASALARFEAAIARGPSHARVETVDQQEAMPHGRATGFVVRG